MREDRAAALFAQVIERLDRIEGALVGAHGTGARDAQDEELVVAVAASSAGTGFTSRELVDHARRADGTLWAALLAADCPTARELGWLLRRVCGREIRGVRVERVDNDHRDGIVWRCVFSGFSGETRKG